MLFSGQPDSELPSIGDKVETTDGPMIVGLTQRDEFGTYWLMDLEGKRRYPVEVIRRGIGDGSLAEVNVEAFYYWIKDKLTSQLLTRKEYQAWCERLNLVNVEGSWVWNPVLVVADGDPCRVQISSGGIVPLPRKCIRGLAR